MMGKFFFVFLISIISAHTVSIGSCVNYSPDGQSCLQCIPNYHLFEGLCYVDILGCTQYQFGNICHQCSKNYILVNNMCCDVVCMSKIFSKFKKEVKRQIIANNTEILSQLIPFARAQYLKDTTGRLVAIQVKDYQQTRRFFLLYEFYQNQFYSKRLVVDYIIKTKKFIIVDWTEVKNSWKYSTVEWTEVQNDKQVLSLYPALYPAQLNYQEVIARKALLSVVQQYQIATRKKEFMDLKILYLHNNTDLIILKEINSQMAISTAQTPTQNTTQTPADIATPTTLTQLPSTSFSPYELKYQGVDIHAQLDVNDPLLICANAVKADERWSHTLSIIVESGKIPDIVEFLIIGENEETGSIMKYLVKYNKPTEEAFIISITEETVQVVQTASTVTEPTTQTSRTITPTVELTESQVIIIQQGCSTHTYYTAPLSPDMQILAQKLLQIKKQAQINGSTGSSPTQTTDQTSSTTTDVSSGDTAETSTPFISSGERTFRRLVMSQFCTTSQYRQVAYVQGDSQSRQYFTYYFQANNPDETWYYMNQRNKSQNTTVWNNPAMFQINITDPSFAFNGGFYYQSGVNSSYNANLSSSDQAIYSGLTAVASSQINRDLGKAVRFSVDVKNDTASFRSTGWNFKEIPPGLIIDSGSTVSILCAQTHVTQTLMIGSSWPKKNTTTATNVTNTTTIATGTTTISTSVLGDQTVTTTNINTFLNEDEILEQIMNWLIKQKPVLSDYTLSDLKISEYQEALEYHLGFKEINLNNDPSLVPLSEIKSVVVHEKGTHGNTLISLQIIETAPVSTTPTTVTDQVHAGTEQISTPRDEYVVVEIKTEQDFTPTSTDTTSTNSTTSTPNGTNASTSQIDSKTPTLIPTTQEIGQIEQKQRINQITESIIQQLEINYNLTEPILIQILQQINPAENTLKLTLITESQTEPKQKYTVIAIGQLNSQNDPFVESVKPVAQQVVDKLIPISEPVTTTLTCDKKTVKSEGQQVCLQQTTSGETDIIPDPSKPASSSTIEPSRQVIQLIEQKSFQSSSQSQGQIRKINVNPQTSTLSEDVKQVLDLVTKEQQLILQQAQPTQQPTSIKVTAIQVAATNIYTHYAITIRYTYKTYVAIIRFFFVRTHNVEGTTSTATAPLYMGKQDLATVFDPLLTQNRAFTDLLTLEKKPETETTYQKTITTLNNQAKTKFIIQKIIYFRYRIFPIGTYQKITLKNDLIVANSHIIIRNGQDALLVNFHEVPIAKPIETTTTTTTNNTSTTTIATPVDSSKTSSSVPTLNTSNVASSGTNTTVTEPLIISTTSISTPQDLINELQKATSQQVVISLSLEQKLGQVLHYLSEAKAEELAGCSLERYAATEDRSIDGTLNAVQFDLYFIKFITDELIREYISSAVRHEANGKIDIALFLNNDINLQQEPSKNLTNHTSPAGTPVISSGTPSTTTNTTSKSTNTIPTTTTPTTVEEHIVDQQVKTNSDFILVDPNQLNYPEAISLIEQDPSKQQFDQNIDLKTISPVVDEIIKYLRAKYVTILNSGILRVVLASKTTTVQKYRIYFFKEGVNNQYEVYQAIINYSSQTVEKRFNMISFELYASNHQLASAQVQDLSLKDGTDIAYGYIIVELKSIAYDVNLQNVFKYLNSKYREIVFNKNVVKIEQLKLFDGRINYKILYRDATTQSEFKFIIFYQPLLQKVLVLNSVNLPHHSQYNQISSDQQKSDSLFTSVLTHLNSIHPQISGFVVRSASKAVETTFSEYQITAEHMNKKYKSLIRVASNNVDLNEIDFSEIVEISLDHYRLDQFDDMFIMNYQKLSEIEFRTNTKVRMVLNFLHDTQQITDSELLGAAYKPYGLGFLYKIFLTIGAQRQLTTAEVYIEAYSDKITLKSYKKVDFNTDMLQINVQQPTVAKIITLIKQKATLGQFTVQAASAKDFLYGTLYKLMLANQNGNVETYVNHDHSTEQITPLFIKLNYEQSQCLYQNAECVSCKSANFRVYNNQCFQNVKNCDLYAGQICSKCDSISEIFNGVCIQKSNCGSLCQVIAF